MRHKGKFLVSVASLALSMLFLLAGVYSATNTQVAISGKISFTPVDVYLNYSIIASAPYESGQTPIYTAKGSGAFTGSDQLGKSADLGDVDLNDYQRFYSYKITFERRDGFIRQYYIFAESFPSSNTFINVSITKTSGVTGTITTGSGFTVSGAISKVEITVTFEIIENNGVTNPDNFELGATFRLSV